MPVYALEEDLVFPHPSEAEEDGLLAVGGDLSAERLLLAYANGIFPWYADDTPILWWSPNPRMLLFPQDFILRKSLKQKINNAKFQLRCDTAFEQVITECSQIKRKEEEGTWITDEMQQAYVQLHKLGFAHSVEVFEGNNLVGGLYGVSLGAAFFGESMFSKATDSSKIALYYLCRFCIHYGFEFIDCQMYTEHLSRMGAKEIPQEDFLQFLAQAMEKKTKKGAWTKLFEDFIEL